MATKLKSIVSKKKKRYQANGFDLDLSCNCLNFVNNFVNIKILKLILERKDEVKLQLNNCKPLQQAIKR